MPFEAVPKPLKKIAVIGAGISGMGAAHMLAKTHHVTRNAFLAEVENKGWKVLETFEQQAPLDTAAVCDLVANPNDTTQYEIDI